MFCFVLLASIWVIQKEAKTAYFYINYNYCVNYQYYSFLYVDNFSKFMYEINNYFDQTMVQSVSRDVGKMQE